MKKLCQYADCPHGHEVDTKRDDYFFTGTGSYQMFYHTGCYNKNAKILVPLSITQLKDINKAITAVVETLKDEDVPNSLVDAYRTIGHYVRI